VPTGESTASHLECSAPGANASSFNTRHHALA
jgi:hypothetical protein